jgi:DNA helicase HerA-like ATPase
VHGGKAHAEAQVRVPLSMMNRHGLIAGATGTGKTKTLQLLAEQLSSQGVPVVLADVKGDLSGLAQPGQFGDRITARAAERALKAELAVRRGPGGVGVLTASSRCPHSWRRGWPPTTAGRPAPNAPTAR